MHTCDNQRLGLRSFKQNMRVLSSSNMTHHEHSMEAQETENPNACPVAEGEADTVDASAATKLHLQSLNPDQFASRRTTPSDALRNAAAKGVEDYPVTGQRRPARRP
mmetsp:Transcript_14082/g.23290  ORF Transcript_14082/g.23290 Transcript_14082/m.23290 type:complete len:107 (+) Transcript_14082:37-357(+)